MKLWPHFAFTRGLLRVNPRDPPRCFHDLPLLLLSIFVSRRPNHHQTTRNRSARESRGDSIHSLLILRHNTIKNTHCSFLLFLRAGLHAAALFLLSIFVSHRPTHHEAARNRSACGGRGDSIHSLLILSHTTQKYPDFDHFYCF